MFRLHSDNGKRFAVIAVSAVVLVGAGLVLRQSDHISPNLTPIPFPNYRASGFLLDTGIASCGSHYARAYSDSNDAMVVRVWDVGTCKQVDTLTTSLSARPATSVEIKVAPHGEYLYLKGGGMWSLLRWSGRSYSNALNGNSKRLRMGDPLGVAFSPDSRHLAIAGVDEIHIIRLADMRNLNSISLKSPAMSVAFQGTQAVLFSQDEAPFEGRIDKSSRLIRWDFLKNTTSLLCEVDTHLVRRIATSPTSVATAGFDLDCSVRCEGCVVRLNEGAVVDLSFSSSGKFLVAGCSSGKVAVIQADPLRLLYSVEFDDIPRFSFIDHLTIVVISSGVTHRLQLDSGRLRSFAQLEGWGGYGQGIFTSESE